MILTLLITFSFQSRTLAKRALRELRLLRVMAHKNVRPSPSNYTSLLIYSLIKIVKLLTIQLSFGTIYQGVTLLVQEVEKQWEEGGGGGGVERECFTGVQERTC